MARSWLARSLASLLLVSPLALAPACGTSTQEGTSPTGSLGGRADAGADTSETDGASGDDGGSGGAGGGDAGTWPGAAQVCYLLTCTGDADCAGCTFGRSRCDTATTRCVACNPATMTGCPAGKTCTQYGTCVAAGSTCPATCQGDQDCAACDAQHQACDAATHTCKACSATNTSVCAPNEACSAGACVKKCPSTCAADADCGLCGQGAGAAHACNANTHTCAQCSATSPCPGKQVCSPQGRCIEPCGLSGEPKGSCLVDGDCKGCGNVAIACHQPINGGIGKCGVPASGCSDLGMGVTALPPPWDAVTQTCSTDMDCSGAGLALNVGKLLRDLTGVEQIGDATIQYDMNACAAISIQGVSCGLCVPCRSDADCKPIQLDPVLSKLFGPLGAIAEKWILDQVFGPGVPHELQMYCENVAGDYGVCAPCSDPTQVCGVAQTMGAMCSNDYECAWGEICKSGQCVSVKNGCTTDQDCSGSLCGWNGMGYCCQPSGAPKSSYCFTDVDCTTAGEVCIKASDGHFYCNAPQCK